MSKNPLRELRKILKKKYSADVVINKYRAKSDRFVLRIPVNDKGRVLKDFLTPHCFIINYDKECNMFILIFKKEILETLIAYCRII